MVRFWQRMGAIYGHKWTSAFGESPFSEVGVLTVAGDTWQRGLAGIPERSIADGLQAALLSADGWPPTLPAFRALCFDLPAFSVVRREAISGQRSEFTTLVIDFLDHFRWKLCDQDKADKLLKEAYDEAAQHVMRGGELPEQRLAIRQEFQAPQQKTPEEQALADQTAKEAIESLRASLGIVE